VTLSLPSAFGTRRGEVGARSWTDSPVFAAGDVYRSDTSCRLRRQVSELVELAGVDRLDVHEVPTHGGRGQLEQQPDLFGVTSPGLMAAATARPSRLGDVKRPRIRQHGGINQQPPNARVDSHLQGAARCTSTARGLAAPARTRRSHTGIAVLAAVLVATALLRCPTPRFRGRTSCSCAEGIGQLSAQERITQGDRVVASLHSWAMACRRSRCRCYLPMILNGRHRASHARRRVPLGRKP
jgi:hypothetical protein